jgi:putative endonuclease
MKKYYTYILTNKSNRVLHVGMTNNLLRRVWEHKSKLIEGFTKRYNVDILVYFESFNTKEEAIKREKQLKSGSRNKKIELINQLNTEWKELFNLEVLYK